MNLQIRDKFTKIKELNKDRYNSDNKSDVDKEIFEIFSNLKEQSLELFKNPSSLKLFLDNIGKFNNYSYNNQLLIYLQKPDSMFVAPFMTYKKLGYSVKAKPDSINIIVPIFLTLVKDNNKNEIRYLNSLNDKEKKQYKDKDDNSIVFNSKKLSTFGTGTVFDISDTTMPFEEIQESLHPNVNSQNASYYLNIIEKVVEENNFELIYDNTGKVDGYCDHKNKKLVISDNQSDLVKIKTTLHELAHALAHIHLENNNQEYQKYRNKYETEAESIAYVVSNYLHLDVPNSSETYLYAWSKKKDFAELDNSLETIVSYSSKIISNIKSFLPEKNKDYNDSLNI